MQIEKSISVFLNYCRSKQLRPKTIRSYEQALLLFARWLRESESVDLVEQVYEITVRDYILYLQERGKYSDRVDERSEKINRPANRRDYRDQISNTTINNYLRAIRAWCNWLVEQEVLDKSPMKRIKLLKQQRKPREFLTDDEVKELMNVFDKARYAEYRDMMIAMVMLETGTRLGETLSITVDRVDLFEQTILLPGDKTKSRKDRTVFFSQKLAKELRRWLRYKECECDTNYLFPVRETGFMLHIGNYERNFRNYMARTRIGKHIARKHQSINILHTEHETIYFCLKN